MGVLTTGNTFSTGDQVTASKLNNAVNSATFQSAAVDNTSTQLSGGAIIVKDLGITQGKISSDAVGTNQLANDVVISTSGSITGAAGSFTTLSASGDISVDGSVKQSGNTANLILKGGDTDGANIELYGASHASQANQAFYDASTHSFRPEDGSSNRVVISSSGLTASGDLTVDTSTLKVDSTNNRVGIGTASPAQTLDVDGGARVTGTLFVGIDDTTPNGLIEVYGGGTGQNEGGEIKLRTAADFDSTYNHYFLDTYQDDFRIGRDGIADIHLTSDGNVGIGTTTPTHKFHVVGEARFGDGGSVNDDLILKGSETATVAPGGSVSGAIITTNGTGSASGHIGVEVPANDADDGFFVATDANLDGTVDKIALKIKANGNVGIGTTAPGSELEVKGNGAEIYINSSDSAFSRVAHQHNGTSIWTSGTRSSDHYHIFRESGSGNVIIDNGSLLVSGTALAQADSLGIDSNGIIYSARASGSATHSIFYNGSSVVGSITTSTSATAFNTSSDYRLKENETNIIDGIDRLKQLSPYRFNFKVDPDETVDGFFAHEVSDIVPEAITGTKDGMKEEEYEVSPAVYEDVVHPAVEATYDEDGQEITTAQEEYTESVLVTEAVMDTRSVPDYQGIDQAKLVPLLTAALQEAVAKIEALEARVQTLKG